jgi:hypothetical protein
MMKLKARGETESCRKDDVFKFLNMLTCIGELFLYWRVFDGKINSSKNEGNYFWRTCRMSVSSFKQCRTFVVEIGRGSKKPIN